MPVLRRFSTILKRKPTEYISSIFSSHKVVFKGKEEITYKGGNQSSFLLNKVFKNIDSIGVIGWGPQARAQACNLQDTFKFHDIKTKITVGLRENSTSTLKATKAGFKVKSIEETTKESDLLLFLVSDSAQASLYKNILSNMKDGATLGLSHGFLLGHMKNNNEEFPENINVIGMCPKGMGDSVRDLYLSNCGLSINSSVCVEKITEGYADKFFQELADYPSITRPIDLALGWAIGVGSPFIFTTSLQDEWVSDLVGERGILLGGLFGIMQSMELLALKYNQPMDKAYNETAKMITGPISRQISKNGLTSVYTDMIKKCDTNFKDTFRMGYCLSYKVAKPLINEIYEEVVSGNEIRSVISAEKNREMLCQSLSGNSKYWNVGKNDEHSENTENSLEEVYINSPTSAMCAGTYIGAMMAQIDVLIENGHNYSEIVNESIIEAVDSLNPYMYRKGIDWMVDNCSITARIGTRKWGPRFHTLYSNNVINNKMHTVPHEEHILFKDYLNHPIHIIHEYIRNMNKN
jgi:ketol-acid reductoisomerase